MQRSCPGTARRKADDIASRLGVRYGSPVGKARILGEFLRFLRVRKKYWLAPIVIVLILLSLLIVFSQGSVLSPFIYVLF